VRLPFVLDSNERRGVARQLEGVGDNEGDRLKVESDLVVLQRAERGTGRTHFVDVGAVGTRQARGVLVREDLQHAKKPECVSGVDAGDPSSRDRARHDEAVGEVREVVLGCVFRLACHLGVRIDPAGRLSDVGRRHAFSSTCAACCRARTTARFASEILNVL
jgi:hypothetical protein